MNVAHGTAWRWLGALILLIILNLLVWFGHGPSANNSCCATASTAAHAETPIDAHYADGKITLTGEVANAEMKQTMLDAAAKAVGAENVIDQLTINADAKENDIVLTGEVPDDATRLNVVNAFSGLTGVDKVDDQLTLKVMAAAPVADPATPQPVACSSAMTLNVTFDTGSANIADAGRAQLDEAVKCITAPTEVAGHTDNVGSAASNKRLSQRRADAVKAYLTTKGVAADLLTAVGYGAENPVGDNATPEGRTQNRRIELNAQ